MQDCKSKDYNNLHSYYNCNDSCPKACCEGTWDNNTYNWAVVNVYKYLFKIEQRLLCSYNTLLNKLFYGYECDNFIFDSIDRYNISKGVLRREVNRLKYHKNCQCEKDLENIFEKIERYEKCQTAAQNVIIETDSSWVKRNLLCASREDWEMYASSLCALWNLEITITPLENQENTKCNIAVEITKSQQFCNILISLALIKHICEMGIIPSITKEKCELEWKLLLEKNSDCNISLKTYTECLELGLTYDLVQLILDSGFDIQSIGGELWLVGLLQKYRFNDLVFRGIPQRTEETEHFYKDPKSFVDKYLKDYRINQLIIEKILNKL